MNTNFLKEMESIQARFYRDDIISAQYVILTTSAHNVLFSLTRNKLQMPAEIQENINTWNTCFAALDTHDWSVRDLIVEKDFIEVYNRFELLITEILASVFRNFPRFLGKQSLKDGLSADSSSDALNPASLQQGRIQKKILSVTRENSTYQQLEYILQITGLTDSIVIEGRDRIILYSILRNCVIHNNRKFTKYAFSQLDKAGIEHSFTVGENVIGYIGQNSMPMRNTFSQAGQKILKDLMDNLLKIGEKHSLLNDDFA